MSWLTGAILCLALAGMCFLVDWLIKRTLVLFCAGAVFAVIGAKMLECAFRAS
jgi:hypothetical protein